MMSLCEAPRMHVAVGLKCCEGSSDLSERRYVPSLLRTRAVVLLGSLLLLLRAHRLQLFK
jgi:hypothetical protein